MGQSTITISMAIFNSHVKLPEGNQPALGLFFSAKPAQERDQVRRFITLIDALYESHAKMVCTAALDPISLCSSCMGWNMMEWGPKKYPIDSIDPRNENKQLELHVSIVGAYECILELMLGVSGGWCCGWSGFGICHMDKTSIDPCHEHAWYW